MTLRRIGSSNLHGKGRCTGKDVKHAKKAPINRSLFVLVLVVDNRLAASTVLVFLLDNGGTVGRLPLFNYRRAVPIDTSSRRQRPRPSHHTMKAGSFGAGGSETVQPFGITSIPLLAQTGRVLLNRIPSVLDEEGK